MEAGNTDAFLLLLAAVSSDQMSHAPASVTLPQSLMGLGPGIVGTITPSCPGLLFPGCSVTATEMKLDTA